MDGKDLSQLRIAIIHFWLTGMRGGERGVESLYGCPTPYQPPHWSTVWLPLRFFTAVYSLFSSTCSSDVSYTL